ncbi:MAG: hypothetical protein IJ493_07265 [Clostridia bacterium]|nr:hypothetical protein [Clostridia bacterium]
MDTDTEFARLVEEYGVEAAYDEVVKRLLSTRELLAWIMKGCVAEYKGCTVREIADCYIEGEPQVSSVPVRPEGEQIRGFDTADKSLREKTALYDILFYATLPGSSERIGLFINVEAQNDYYPGYPLVKRGIYYCSRLLSSQFAKEFADGHYEKLKKVYSIWICADAPDWRDNTITQYELTEKYLLGEAGEARENYDLMSVVMICFNEKHLAGRVAQGMEDADTADLVRLLGVLLSPNMKKENKRQILEDDYRFRMTRDIESGVTHMCNLSKGVKKYALEEGIEIGIAQGVEKGMAQGIAQGMEKGMAQGIFSQARNTAFLMLENRMPLSDIQKYTGLSLDDIKKLAQEKNLQITTE